MPVSIFGSLVAALLVVAGAATIWNGWSIISRVGQLDNKELISFLQIVVTFVSAIAIAFLTWVLGRSTASFQADLTKT